MSGDVPWRGKEEGLFPQLACSPLFVLIELRSSQLIP